MSSPPSFQPANPDFRDFVTGYVAAQGYLSLIGVELGRLEPGLVEYRVPYRADLGQHTGVFHGGVIGSVAEGVMGAAAATLVAAGRDVVGASYTLNLLSPAAGALLVARGTVIKPGRRLVVCRADVFIADDGGERPPCAIAQGAMAVVEPRGG